jgi:membrane-bound lytic murein transglycosylase
MRNRSGLAVNSWRKRCSLTAKAQRNHHEIAMQSYDIKSKSQRNAQQSQRNHNAITTQSLRKRSELVALPLYNRNV